MAGANTLPEKRRYRIRKLDSNTLTPGTMDEIVSFSVRAFGEGRDPWVAAATGGDISLAGGMLRSRVAAGSVAEGGHVYAAYEAQGHDPVAVAVWMEPGEELYATSAQREAYYDTWQSQIDPTVAQWWEQNSAVPVKKLVGSLNKDTWNLAFLAVSPDHLRRGVGKLLVQEVQRIATEREEGLSVLTQNQANVGVYQAMGFQLRGNVDIIGGAGGDFAIYHIVQNVDASS